MVLSGYILLYSSSRVRGDGPIRLYISILKSSRVNGDGTVLPMPAGGPLFQISFLIVLILKNSRVRGDVPIRL